MSDRDPVVAAAREKLSELKTLIKKTLDIK
jgi:hypothetical protein